MPIAIPINVLPTIIALGSLIKVKPVPKIAKTSEKIIDFLLPNLGLRYIAHRLPIAAPNALAEDIKLMYKVYVLEFHSLNIYLKVS